MAIIKPFKGFRPKKEFARRIASKPYDVLSSEEARKEARGNDLSFLHVVKPEIDFPPGTSPYSPEIYQKGKENLYRMIDQGILIRDPQDCLYIYAQTMSGKTQYGLVGCASVSDYNNNVIREHELTRPKKENDRKTHIKTTMFQAEPVFFAYPDHKDIDCIVEKHTEHSPEYDFTSEDGIRHRFWVISDVEVVRELTCFFATDIPFTYVADGHHRTAAAAHVGNELRKGNPVHTGREEYNYFLAVHFPESQLNIIDYNRVIRDLNGMTPEIFLEKLRNSFIVEKKGQEIIKPRRLHDFSLYLDGNWYLLTTREGLFNPSDPIDYLDVAILSKQVVKPLLDIRDLRHSSRIDFVGGGRGLEELQRRVDSGEMKMAFALYPVSMEQLMDIADTGKIMPPKTTWFEPKLRSGLILHSLKD